MTISLLSHRLRPTPGAVSARPYTAAEIDALPNADRVWATIVEMRKDVSLSGNRDFPSHYEVGRGWS